MKSNGHTVVFESGLRVGPERLGFRVVLLELAKLYIFDYS